MIQYDLSPTLWLVAFVAKLFGLKPASLSLKDSVMRKI